MRAAAIAAVLTAAVALAGCPRDPAPGPGNGPGPGNVGGTPAPAGACRTDADCVISCARPGECCDQLCEPCEQAWHRDALAAHEAWRGPACAAVSCPVARCMAPTEETSARCEAGACVVERRPIEE